MRFLALLLASVGVLACSNSETCSDDFMMSNPAIGLAFADAADEDACTIAGRTIREGSVRGMDCTPSQDSDGYCFCYGGDLPGVYEVVIYDPFSGEALDTAEVTVTLDEAEATCRTFEITRPFEGYFSNWGGGGAGGAGGAGGGGGTGGS